MFHHFKRYSCTHLTISIRENGRTLWSCHEDCHRMMHLMTVLSAMLRNILAIRNQYKHFSHHWALNNSQGGKKHDCNSPINVFLRGSCCSLIASVYSVSSPHVPCPTAGCLSIPRLGQLHHIFRFIMSNHFEMLS